MTSSEWAAWVQAVGSVLAIITAALLPLWHQRVAAAQQRKQWLAVLASLTCEVHEMINHATQTSFNSNDRVTTAMYSSKDQYQPLIDALASFPAHMLTERSQLVALFEARRLAARAQNVWHTLVAHGDEDRDWHEVMSLARNITECAEDLMEKAAAFR